MMGTIRALTRPTGESSNVFDGSFGLDLLTGRQELTLNYDAMRISLRRTVRGRIGPPGS